MRKFLVQELWTSANTLQVPSLCKALKNYGAMNIVKESHQHFTSTSLCCPAVVKGEPVDDDNQTSWSGKHKSEPGSSGLRDCTAGRSSTLNDENSRSVCQRAVAHMDAEDNSLKDNGSLVKLEPIESCWPTAVTDKAMMSNDDECDSDDTVGYFSDEIQSDEESFSKVKECSKRQKMIEQSSRIMKPGKITENLQNPVCNRAKSRSRKRKTADIKQEGHFGELKAKCAYCGMVSMYRRVRKHTYEQHFDEFMPEDQVSKTKDKNPLKIRCLSCGQEVVRRHYAMHVLTVHPAGEVKKTNRGRHHKFTVGCLFCSVTIKNRKYRDHFEEVHPELTDKYYEILPQVAQEKFLNRPKVSDMEKVAHLMMFACAYCETDDVRVKFDDYKAHVLENHPKFYEMNVKSLSNISLLDKLESGKAQRMDKEELERSKYLYIDRSRYLPEVPPLPKEFKCFICQQKLSNKRDYYQHGMDLHGFKKRSTVMCPYCFILFKSHQDKINHEDEVHAVEKYMCETCGKDFVRSTSLRIHKDNVHLGYVKDSLLRYKRKPKTLLCNQCGAQFGSTTSLKYHTQTKHDKSRSYVCSQCDKRFSCPHGLKKHQLIHGSESSKKFSCTMCSYKANRRHVMEHHLRIHTGEKPYKCNLCECRFRISLTLRWHLENKHGIKETGKVFQKYYQPEKGLQSEAAAIMESMVVDSEDELVVDKHESTLNELKLDPF